MSLSRCLSALSLILALLASPSFGQVDEVPPISVKGDSIEVGRHAPGANAIEHVKVRNNSEETLTISRVAGNCPCMGIMVRDDRIEPGRTGQIILSVDTPMKMGRMTRMMYVFAEGFRRPLQIPVHADLEYAVVVNPGDSPEIESRSGTLTLESVDGRAFRVTSVGGESPAESTRGATHELDFDLGEAPTPELPRFLVIETDHPGARIIPVRVSVPGVWEAWRVRKRIQPVNEQETLIPIAPGGSKKILIEMAGVTPGKSESVTVRSSNPKVSAEVLAVRQPPQGGGGAAIDVRLRINPSLRGPFATVLTITHKDHEAGLDFFGVAEKPERGGPGLLVPNRR